MAVMIKDGEDKFPGAVITVNSVKVDGKELTLDGKPYTSSDDDGDSATAASFIGDYSPQAVNPDDFADGWTNVEVNFTISGIAE